MGKDARAIDYFLKESVFVLIKDIHLQSQYSKQMPRILQNKLRTLEPIVNVKKNIAKYVKVNVMRVVISVKDSHLHVCLIEMF
jgi:hypothetical protein